MKKPKPYFKERIAIVGKDVWDGQKKYTVSTRVRVTDARRPSALRAVEKVLKEMISAKGMTTHHKAHDGCAVAGMTYNATTGKCQWRDK